MKSIFVSTVIFFSLVACLVGSAQAQFDYDYGFGGGNFDQYYNQIAQQHALQNQQWEQFQQDLQRRYQQTTQQLEQMEQQNRARIIQGYRQQTGDYQTPDQVVVERCMQQYYAQNPQAWQQKMADDARIAQGYQKIAQQRAQDNQTYFNNMNAIHNDKVNYISNLSMTGFNNRMHSMDVQSHNFNNMIHERSDYYNPHTGQVSNLSYHPNQIQTHQGQHFYTDHHGQQFQLQPNGWGQRLNDWNW
ncbi:MAG: hypothetical protein JNL67_19145 [Planctomycetaceae bacterium]|nr:hypothetical protein [Planctomycetaceae bacterium]